MKYVHVKESLGHGTSTCVLLFRRPLSSSMSRSWSTIDIPFCSFPSTLGFLLVSPGVLGRAGDMGKLSEGDVSCTICNRECTRVTLNKLMTQPDVCIPADEGR